MSILSVYQHKRRLLREVVVELTEFMSATDIPIAAKFGILQATHVEKILPGMKELCLAAPPTPVYQKYLAEHEKQLRDYFSILDRDLGREPVDTSAGRS